VKSPAALDLALWLALTGLGLLGLRFLYYFISFFEQLARLWLGT
jgi:hypothetical protein